MYLVDKILLNCMNNNSTKMDDFSQYYKKSTTPYTANNDFKEFVPRFPKQDNLNTYSDNSKTKTDFSSEDYVSKNEVSNSLNRFQSINVSKFQIRFETFKKQSFKVANA